MPQMSPYNWLILFMIFNLILMYMIIHNHSTFLIKMNYKNNTFNYFKYNWKW